MLTCFLIYWSCLGVLFPLWVTHPQAYYNKQGGGVFSILKLLVTHIRIALYSLHNSFRQPHLPVFLQHPCERKTKT